MQAGGLFCRYWNFLSSPPDFGPFLQLLGLRVLPGGVGGQQLRLLGLLELLGFAEIQLLWRLIAHFELQLPLRVCNEKRRGDFFLLLNACETKKMAKVAELAGG